MKRILRTLTERFYLAGFCSGNLFSNARPVRVSGMPLTPRQRDVLELLWCGLSDTEIAGALGISERTARIHTAVLLPMLKLSSREKATAMAISWDGR